ncbi:sigma-70 family RNA polymerase sigma factor [Metaplanococcus flavidus]
MPVHEDTKISDEEMKKIMDTHGEYLIRLAYFYVKDWLTAEDIMQEVFISYYRKSAQFDNRASLKTYLSKIAVNKCRDHLRSWKNKRSLFSNGIGGLISSGKSPEAALEQHTFQGNLTNKILELPVKYREVILLFYYQEFTSKEISELLNCSENTVKTRLRRAKDLLREKVDLKEWEGMQDE